MEIEKLFQTSSIAAVREVETKTRHEIEEKKKQLRSVVGDSYRDLISSADTIIDMERSCRRLVDLTAGLESGLGGLAARAVPAGGEPGGGGEGGTDASSYDRLYALGSRIKYLVDTPETIYGCLDAGEFLEASRRSVRAAEVHRALTAGGSKQVAQRFPLLQHQWPLVKKFRPQVYSAAAGWLASHGELSAAQAAATLAAQALLKPQDGAEVLKGFLTARQSYLMQCLSAATGAGADTDLDSLACILADVATLVCATLAQAGELFLPLPGVSAQPLLAAALGAEDGPSADLIFDSGREAEAWRVHVESVRGRLSELSAAGLALECSQWLDQVSQQLRSLGGRLLGPCASGQGLLAVEGAVRAALEGWRYSLAPSDSMLLEGGEAGAGAGAGAPVSLAWADVCQWVLGRPAPLWPLLFEQPLLERAKQLVGRDFSAVVDQVAELLTAALQEAAAQPPSAPGFYQAAGWADTVQLDPCTPDAAAGGPAGASKRRRLAGPAKPARSAGAAQPQAWLPHAEHIVSRFDEQLSKALDAALDACGGAAQQPSGGAAGGGAAAAAGKRPGGLAETAASRAAVLEPFVQDRCAEAAEGVAASLDARLLSLPKDQQPEAAAAAGGEDAAASGAPTAIQSLILGRVALGLASRSRMLPLVLGPPDQWRAAAHGGDAAAAGRQALPGSARLPAAPAAAPAPASPRYERLQQRLHAVGLQAYGVWVDWAAAGLAGSLVGSLAADPSMAADAPLRSWEETVISSGAGGAGGEGAGGGAGTDMRFWLPAAASPPAVQAALAACAEADRAGGHLLESEALALLKWRLGAALLAALLDGLGDGDAGGDGGAGLLGGRLSEKGVLQLLFDVRFLTDLLAGAAPVGSGPGGAAGGAVALAGRRREVAALEAALAGRLDPIDWATYEPYLYANKERAAARSQVLFGLLLRGDKGAVGGAAHAAGGSMPAESNSLLLAPVAPRFSYLPVTTPAALLRQASHPALSGLQHSGSGSAAELARMGSSLGLGLAGNGGAAAAAAAAPSGADVSAGAYSFATLLSSKAKAGGDEDGGYAAAGAMGASASGVASKLVGSLGLFGEQLGDQAGGLLSSLGARFATK